MSNDDEEDEISILSWAQVLYYYFETENIEKFKSINVDIDRPITDNLMTFIHLLIKKRWMSETLMYEFLHYLLRKIDINRSDDEGIQPITYAIIKKKYNLFEIFLKHGCADISNTDLLKTAILNKAPLYFIKELIFKYKQKTVNMLYWALRVYSSLNIIEFTLSYEYIDSEIQDNCLVPLHITLVNYIGKMSFNEELFTKFIDKIDIQHILYKSNDQKKSLLSLLINIIYRVPESERYVEILIAKTNIIVLPYQLYVLIEEKLYNLLYILLPRCNLHDSDLEEFIDVLVSECSDKNVFETVNKILGEKLINNEDMIKKIKRKHRLDNEKKNCIKFLFRE